ncbi:MAG: hypothetical protein ACO3K9_14070 [Paracoccaceae bacterium]
MKRRVFYIPGFDPFPPRRYRELYRREGQEQARITGYQLDQYKANFKAGYGWRAELCDEAGKSEAEIEVLMWSDIVKTSMSSGIFFTYLNMLKTAWIYISTGTLLDIVKLRKGPVIAALYPIGFLIVQLAIALGVAYGVSRLLVAIRPMLSWVALVIIWPVLALFQKYDHKVFAYYLMQDYAHSAKLRGAYPPELKERLRQFKEKISVALTEEWDEILVVGHSSGAHLAVSVLAELSRDGQLKQATCPLGFLSLGQVVPMVAFLPDAKQLRQDLRDLSESDDLTWIDVTAPGDGCSFALCDPVAVCGVARDAQKWPLVLSAAFTQTLSASKWKAVRWRFFRLHFQYLCAFDHAEAYDYFQITAGSKTLAARFKGRSPSKSRILTPTARYRALC